MWAKEWPQNLTTFQLYPVENNCSLVQSPIMLALDLTRLSLPVDNKFALHLQVANTHDGFNEKGLWANYTKHYASFTFGSAKTKVGVPKGFNKLLNSYP